MGPHHTWTSVPVFRRHSSQAVREELTGTGREVGAGGVFAFVLTARRMVGSTIGIYGIEVKSSSQAEQLLPPHAAARDGDIDTIKRLISEQGEGILKSPDGNGWTPVHVAARAHPSPRTRNLLLVGRSALLVSG